MMYHVACPEVEAVLAQTSTRRAAVKRAGLPAGEDLRDRMRHVAKLDSPVGAVFLAALSGLRKRSRQLQRFAPPPNEFASALNGGSE